MSHRMSSRERLERLAQEAAITAREKEEKRKAREDSGASRSTGGSTSSSSSSGTAARAPRAPRASRSIKSVSTPRMKIVWVIRDRNGKAVKSFPFPEKDAATAEAARLSAEQNATFAVLSEKIPME